MKPPTARVIEHNLSTAMEWQAYSSHRETVTRLLLEAAGDPVGMSLCLVGAGNCNDVDLVRLRERFGEIHLVDLDESAMRRAVARQLGVNRAARSNIVIHGAVDVAGVLEALARPVDPVELAAIATGASPHVGGAPFDVVASLCVVTQIIDSVVTALGTDDPAINGAVTAVRNRHLAILGELARPEGRVVFVTDFVSADTAPDILEPGAAGLDLMKRHIADRNFITGTNPVAIEQVCRGEPAVPLDVESFVTPWIWDLGRRSYLAYALVMRPSPRTD